MGIGQDREIAEPREIAELVEFVIFRQAAGRLADNATEWINAYFAKHPEAEIVYGDEDLMNEKGERCIPWYKPCWSPDLYRAFFYVGSVVAVRSSLLQRMGRKSGRDGEREHRKGNSFYRCRRDPVADGSPVFGSRRVRERLPFHRSYGNRVVPWNFFCRRNRNPGTGCTCRPGQPGVHSLGKLPAEKESPQLAVELASRAAEGAKELFAGELKVSVIIPSKDNPEVLEKCLHSLTRRSEAGSLLKFCWWITEAVRKISKKRKN